MAVAKSQNPSVDSSNSLPQVRPTPRQASPTAQESPPFMPVDRNSLPMDTFVPPRVPSAVPLPTTTKPPLPWWPMAATLATTLAVAPQVVNPKALGSVGEHWKNVSDTLVSPIHTLWKRETSPATTERVTPPTLEKPVERSEWHSAYASRGGISNQAPETSIVYQDVPNHNSASCSDPNCTQDHLAVGDLFQPRLSSLVKSLGKSRGTSSTDGMSERGNAILARRQAEAEAKAKAKAKAEELREQSPSVPATALPDSLGSTPA
ncbi:MAG: hypothetical protein ACKO34_04950, partial [Vampirovibrionales bacterium]